MSATRVQRTLYARNQQRGGATNMPDEDASNKRLLHSDQLLTAGQVAALLEVDDSTVRRWIAAKMLPAVLLPGLRPRYRVRRADAEALMPRPVAKSA